MTEVVYDMNISEVASTLGKSDRQVRRYVKEKRLKSVPQRVDGHIKLMFNREEVLEFAEQQGLPPGPEVVVDARLVDKESDGEPEIVGISDVIDINDSEPTAVKYVIDALKDQIAELRKENRELHYNLEQRSGQVGFLQSKVETLQEEMKALMPSEAAQDEIIKRKPWYRRIFGRE